MVHPPQFLRFNLCPLLLTLIASASWAADVRTYTFLGDAPAYRFSCGECGGYPYVVRARIEGTFQVSLDFEKGNGTLLSLDAHLVNPEGYFGLNGWQPVPWQAEFLSANPLNDIYRPPYPGILQAAEYRPLGPATLTEAHYGPYIGMPVSQIPPSILFWMDQGVGFESAPKDSWLLSFNGALPSPDGVTIRFGASYNIYLEGNSAWLTYYVPIEDAVPSIAAAAAIRIPEPTLFLTTITSLTVFMVMRRQR